MEKLLLIVQYSARLNEAHNSNSKKNPYLVYISNKAYEYIEKNYFPKDDNFDIGDPPLIFDSSLYTESEENQTYNHTEQIYDYYEKLKIEIFNSFEEGNDIVFLGINEKHVPLFKARVQAYECSIYKFRIVVEEYKDINTIYIDELYFIEPLDDKQHYLRPADKTV